jgi:uncharacterized membrane protein
MVYVITLLAVLIWLALIMAAPLLVSREHYFSSLLIYRSFSAVCHQLPERSFELSGYPLAVCARCTGIYAGFLLGLFIYPLARRLDDETMPDRRWLLLAAAPMLIDFAGNAVGLFTNSFASRTITGLIAGAATAFYLLPGLVAVRSQFSQGRAAARACAFSIAD